MVSYNYESNLKVAYGLLIFLLVFIIGLVSYLIHTDDNDDVSTKVPVVIGSSLALILSIIGGFLGRSGGLTRAAGKSSGFIGKDKGKLVMTDAKKANFEANETKVTNESNNWLKNEDVKTSHTLIEKNNYVGLSTDDRKLFDRSEHHNQGPSTKIFKIAFMVVVIILIIMFIVTLPLYLTETGDVDTTKKMASICGISALAGILSYMFLERAYITYYVRHPAPPIYKLNPEHTKLD